MHISQKILSVACVLLTTFPNWHHCLSLMGNSRVLDLRKEGPIISSILSPIVQYFPALNTCRMHQDLRRSRLQPPTQKTPGLQLHRKMNRCWWPILLHSRPKCPQRTVGKILSPFITCKTMHHLDETPRMRKFLCSWLLDLFRPTTLHVDLAFETSGFEG